MRSRACEALPSGTRARALLLPPAGPAGRPSGLHLWKGGWQPSDDTTGTLPCLGVSLRGFRSLPMQMMALHAANGRGTASFQGQAATPGRSASFRSVTTGMPSLALRKQGMGARGEPGVGRPDSVGFFVSMSFPWSISVSHIPG